MAREEERQQAGPFPGSLRRSRRVRSVLALEAMFGRETVNEFEVMVKREEAERGEGRAFGQ
jgi:hypothetical protein